MVGSISMMTHGAHVRTAVGTAHGVSGKKEVYLENADDAWPHDQGDHEGDSQGDVI